MAVLNLKVITPKKVVLKEEILSITAPAADGEITILPHHRSLFTLLNEGIVKIKKKDTEDYLAIGGGYLQTDGEEVNLLVSRAYGQTEINEKMVEKAIEQAKKIISETKDQKQRIEATALLRRSIIDLKLLKKRRR